VGYAAEIISGSFVSSKVHILSHFYPPSFDLLTIKGLRRVLLGLKANTIYDCCSSYKAETLESGFSRDIGTALAQ